MSTFDADAFMNATTTEQGSTYVPPFPEGDYVATIEEVKVSSGVMTKGDRIGEPWVSAFVTFKLQQLPGKDLDAIAEQLGRPNKQVSQSYFLDVSPNGGLDMSEGRNTRLNRLREAVGQNVSGQPWSIGMLKGAGPLIVRLTQDPSKDDPKEVYNRVSRTSPFAGSELSRV